MPSPRQNAVRAAAALLLAAAGAARAEPVALAFEQSVYVDASQEQKPLKQPQGVACSEAGAVVVADTGNQRLLGFAFQEGRLSGGNEIRLAQLPYPVSVALDSKGGILALDGKTRKLVRISNKGAFEGVLELRGAGASSVIVGGFALDAADAVYVLDIAGRKVIALDPGGYPKREVSLPKQGTFTDIAIDAAGTLYAVDAVDAAVWSAEKDAASFKALTKSLKDRMSFPTHIAVKRGRIYLVDQNGNGIVVLGIDGSFQGRQLSIGWGDGFVYYPSQLCVTDAGQVFVADRSNNRVQYFSVVK